MSSPPINIDTKTILGYESYWNNEPAILEQDIIVLTRDTDIIKKGNSKEPFKDLPTMFDIKNISSIEDKLSYIDTTFDDLDENRLTTIDIDGKIAQSNLSSLNYNKLYQLINDNSMFMPVYINGPNKAYINTSITCTLVGFSGVNKFHRIDDATSIWKLSDNPNVIISSSSNQLSITLPNDPLYIGKTITISGKLIDKLGNISKYVTHDILITASNLEGYVSDTNLVIDAISPTILSYNWNDDNHKSFSTYALTIQTDNSVNYNKNAILSVVCDNTNVSINKDLYTKNKYLITYPKFTNDTTINFKISLVNIYGYKDIKQFTQNVIS